jgi:hypothetical protein
LEVVGFVEVGLVEFQTFGFRKFAQKLRFEMENTLS